MLADTRRPCPAPHGPETPQGERAVTYKTPRGDVPYLIPRRLGDPLRGGTKEPPQSQPPSQAL
ncbi:hypothetical protein E2C01_096603 [Portunus trituberculatus]|uniref:Uncharacterized protein n=1 Tax=Portunus trituberculatus TaxID=210409 RepID=A0A5B7JSZ6_PORTR|nr:hypothetical protein [Portunus trituberculatus]